MKLIFADDAAQRRPTRPGMRPLVAVGGLIIPGESLSRVQDRLEQLCADVGFPKGEEFKWSPSRNQWMYGNLVREDRRAFYRRVLAELSDAHAEAIVVLEDVESSTATGCASAQEDVVVMFLERIANRLRDTRNQGIVVTDRPGGGRSEEDQFLDDCAGAVERGTRFVALRDAILGVYSAPSTLSRLLQAADLITGCTAALFSGEAKFAPDVFPDIRPLFPRKLGRIGGASLKVHPDYRYCNLYHWLAADELFVRYPMGVPMPLAGRPYFHGPDEF